MLTARKGIRRGLGARGILLGLLLILSYVGGLPLSNLSPPTIQGQSNSLYRDREVICKVWPGQDVGALARRLGLTLLDSLGGDMFLLGLPPLLNVPQALLLLNRDPSVEWAEPNFLFRLAQLDQRSQAFVDQRSQAFVDGRSPSDYFDQYATHLLRLSQAQAITRGGGITVAVIDTGIDPGHPVFAALAEGYDFVDRDRDPTECGSGPAYGHGTMVAGIVALTAREAAVMPLRVFTSEGTGAASDIVKAIRFAAMRGAQVINMSFGLPTTSQAVREALRFAKDQGVVLIASAGNNNSSTPQFPASEDALVWAVAATDAQDRKADFSNYGAFVDVCAPGVSIYSAYPGGRYAWWSGTSFSAPFVSGTVALVLSIGRSPDRVRQTALYVGGGLGYGRIDAWQALTR